MLANLFHILATWLLHYGPVILFLVLILGIIALPLPDESLLIIAGMLMAHGKLALFPTIFAAISGSICGISLSYYLGYLTGPFLLRKYGPVFNITQPKIEMASAWISKFGKWTLLICYFIPLIRHLAGYLSGSSRLKFRVFTAFAYSGAIIWSLSYLAVGYFLNKSIQWLK